MNRKFCFTLPLLLTVTFGSAIAFPAKGQETNVAPGTNAVTLDALIAEAGRNNPELRALEAGAAAARGEVVTAKTWDNPDFGITPGVYRQDNGSGGDTSFGHVGFELKQTILFPGKRALMRAVAEKNVQTRELALAGFQTQLAIQVRRSFYELLAVRQIVALKEQQMTLAGTFVEAARKKVEGGFAPEFEQTKAEVELATAQKALRDAQAQEAVARTALNSLAGREPEAPLTPAGTLTETVAVPDEATLLKQAMERNPSLKVQTAEVERTGLSLALTKKSRLPDFTIGPTVEYQQPEQVYGIGISLPLPLWNRKKGEIATATAEQQRALAELDALRRDVARDTSSAWQLLTSAKESLALYTPEFRDKLKSALDAAAQSYGEGRTSLLIYLETQRTYYDTEADYFETLQKLYDAQAALEAALGVPLSKLKTPVESPKNDK